MQKTINIFKHIGIWIFVALLFHVMYPYKGEIKHAIMLRILVDLNKVVTFYLFAILIYPKLYPKSIYLIISIAISYYFIFGFSHFVTLKFIIPNLGIILKLNNLEYRLVLINDFLVYSLLCLAAWTYFYNKYNIRIIKEQNDKENKQIARKLQLLKQQFNAHLTFNFLNFCYSKVHKYSDSVANAIEVFSMFLKNTLEKCDKNTIPLENEIEHINQYIELIKISSSKTNIKNKFKSDFGSYEIFPSLLYSIVESEISGVFLNDPIIINMEVKNASISLEFRYLCNPKSKTQEELNLNNEVKSILQNYYQNDYVLNVRRTNNYINKSLFLKLNSLKN